MTKLIKNLLITLLLLPLASVAKPINIIATRLTASHTDLRLVIEFDQEPVYHIFMLKHPDRIVLDLETASPPQHLPKIANNNTFITEIRSSKRPPDHSRIVIELKHPANYKHFILAPNKHYPWRLVVDLHHSAQQVKIPKKLRNVVVIIDPGHGGKDPGATGKRGTHEKDIVLAIAKKLKRRLDQEPGITAILTRRGNYYIGLRQRLRIARRNKADIFISIHADAFNKRSSHGASVFALSLGGASSEAARWLAEKENQSELLGGVALHGKSQTLQSVLLDLSQTATISASLQLGDNVLHSLHAIARLHHERVEQAGFVVLKSPDIPSILIETGFLSNPKEERKLRDPYYQRRIAQAIVNGINQYFAHKAPRGSWLAAHR